MLLSHLLSSTKYEFYSGVSSNMVPPELYKHLLAPTMAFMYEAYTFMAFLFETNFLE